MKKNEFNLIKSHFGDGAIVNKGLFRSFLLNNLQNKKENFIHYYMFDLSINRIAYTLDRKNVKVSNRKRMQFEIGEILYKINQDLKSIVYDFKYCLWDTDTLSEFMTHQLMNRFIFLEVEEAILENVFYELRDLGYNIILETDLRSLKKYLVNDSIILSRLIKNTPIVNRRNVKSMGANFSMQKYDAVPTPKLEKILVDIYRYEYDFLDYGGEMKNIFKVALHNYQVNFSTLLRYARNRGKKDNIIFYIENIVKFNIKEGEFYDY